MIFIGYLSEIYDKIGLAKEIVKLNKAKMIFDCVTSRGDEPLSEIVWKIFAMGFALCTL